MEEKLINILMMMIELRYANEWDSADEVNNFMDMMIKEIENE
jgi:hypothetical protein